MSAQLILAASLILSGPARAAALPNVVVILADDLGFADAGFTHSVFIPDAAQRPAEVRTPNLDALAQQGIIFSNGYVSGNVCSPTRAGFMTGRYQQRVAIYNAGEGGRGFRVLAGPGNNGPFTNINPIVPAWLKQPGDGVTDYAAGAFGKWHLGLDEVFRNFNNQKTEPTAYTIGGTNGHGQPTNGPTTSSSPGTGSPWHALNRGFDTCFKFMDRGGHDYWNPNDIYTGFTRSGGLDQRADPGRAPGDDDPVELWESGYLINTNRTPANYLTTRITDAACAFIRTNAQAGQPFFCYVPFNAAHDPSQAPHHFDPATGALEVLGTTNGLRHATNNPGWFPDPLWYYEQFPAMQIPAYLNPQSAAEADTIRRRRAVTLAMVHWMDRGVGRIVQALKDEGVFNDTIVVFFSDNGGASGMRASNQPLRGNKATHWEGGIRVPFCFSWPQLLTNLPPGLQGGRVISAPVTSLDILPTLKDAAGVGQLPSPTGLDYTPDGRSWLPLITGATNQLHDYLYWSEGVNGQGAVRMGRWKLVINQASYQIFDLDMDVSETNNLAAQRPDLVRHLRQKYYAWLVDVAADAGQPPQTWTVNTTPGSPGFANLILESFAYPTNALGSETGGSGWAGGWTSENARVLDGALTFASPHYSNGTDNAHVARIISTNNDTGTATRSFPALGGTVWLSFLTTYAGTNTSGAGAGPNNNHETAVFLNGNTSNQVRIYGGNGSAGIYEAGTKMRDVNPNTDTPADATVILHLLKLESNVADESDRLTWHWTTNAAALTNRTTATLANFKSLMWQSTNDWWGDALSSVGLLWRNNSTATSGGLNDRAFDELRLSYGLSDDAMLEAVLRGITDQSVAPTGVFSLHQISSQPAPGGTNRFTMEYDLKRNWIPGGPHFLFTGTLAPGDWSEVSPALIRQLDAFGDTDTFTAEFPMTTPKGIYKVTD